MSTLFKNIKFGTDMYSKSDVDSLLQGKQSSLVSGTNIKTINNQSILESGNIDLQTQITLKTINNETITGTGNISLQPTLQSGVNLKTVNGETLLGNTNINAGCIIVEGYYKSSTGEFYEDSSFTPAKKITGEAGKLYHDQADGGRMYTYVTSGGTSSFSVSPLTANTYVDSEVANLTTEIESVRQAVSSSSDLVAMMNSNPASTMS